MKEFKPYAGSFWKTSVTSGITQDALANIPMVHPPLPEQRAIADFLDTKCSAIDDQIADLESELATLDEYKKSLIYNYVTGKKEVPVDAC